MVEHVCNPTRWDAKRWLEERLERQFFISMLCNCCVEYDGRARSRLGDGDRSVFIKQDGTVFVHQPKGRNPVNWMPAGSHADSKLEGDALVLSFTCINPKELLTIRIKEVYSLVSHKMIDGQELSLVGTEADMVAYLNEHPERVGDFKPAALEEQTRYGFIDLYGSDSSGTPVAVEVKRYKADLNAVTQLRRYVERLKEQLGVVLVKGVLVAPSITGNAKSMLQDWGFTFKEVQPPAHLSPMRKGQAKLKGFI